MFSGKIAFIRLILVVSIFHARPVFVMIVSQALSSTLLPATVACILYLGNRKDLLNEHANKPAANVILLAILAFSIFTAWIGLKGVYGQIAGLG